MFKVSLREFYCEPINYLYFLRHLQLYFWLLPIKNIHSEACHVPVFLLESWDNFTAFCCCCSVAKSCPTLCNPTDYSMQGSSVLHYLPEFAQTHIHWIGDAIQPSNPLPSPPAFNLSQQQGLFQWVSSSLQVTKVLEPQHQSFQWILRVDFL